MPLNILVIVTAYLTTFIVYSFNYLNEFDDDVVTDPTKVSFLKSRKNRFKLIIIYYIILNIILLCYSFYLYGNFSFIVFILILLFGGILYTVIFKVLTRYIPGFKSVYCTALWAYAGSLYVTFFYSESINVFYAFMFAYMFIKLLINAIFFDIKDMDSDRNKNLKTIPLLLGKPTTILLLTILNLFSIVFLFYGVFSNFIPFYGVSLSILSIYTEYYLLKGLASNQKVIVRYTYVMADTEFILWPLVVLIGKLLIK